MIIDCLYSWKVKMIWRLKVVAEKTIRREPDAFGDKLAAESGRPLTHISTGGYVAAPTGIDWSFGHKWGLGLPFMSCLGWSAGNHSDQLCLPLDKFGRSSYCSRTLVRLVFPELPEPS